MTDVPAGRMSLVLATAAVLVASLATYADAAPSAGRAATSPPLQGVTIVLDPGHQLGNHNFPKKINKQVPAGGFKKACNTTGTATNGGVPEATVVWKVTRTLKRRLRARGARVVLTRHSNRQDRWGPCVNVRGRRGNKLGADLKVSIHADGAGSSGRGFHVIGPTNRPKWTGDILKPSRRLARSVKAGLRARKLRVANYIAGGDGLDWRGDLGTINLSDVPTVMVELGNMRNRRDAARLTSKKGRLRYAKGVAGGVRRFLD